MKITSAHWINQEPKGEGLVVRTRHRGPLAPVTTLKKLPNGDWEVKVKEPIRALSPGQSAVLYQGNNCLGGGIII